MSTLTSSYDVAWRKHDFAKYVTDVIPYNSQDSRGWVSSQVLASRLAVIILLTVIHFSKSSLSLVCQNKW